MGKSLLLADEYINEFPKYGHWKDTAICVHGDAAWSFTVMFLTMWHSLCGVEESIEDFRPSYEVRPNSSGYVQPFTDNPLDDEPVGETVYLNLINKAQRYIYITTPYLIVDASMMTALCIAAKSGVDVRIMTPHIPDKKMVFEVTRAYYPQLLAAGVKIYEYTPGFLHAKNFVVDDCFAVVGTINMDFRSLYLHFENGVWLYNNTGVLDIRDDFLVTQTRCHLVTLEQAKEVHLLRRVYRTILKSFSPLM